MEMQKLEMQYVSLCVSNLRDFITLFNDDVLPITHYTAITFNNSMKLALHDDECTWNGCCLWWRKQLPEKYTSRIEENVT